MELSGCPGQSQLIHLDARCTAVDVDSKQPDITVCREISPNSVGAETSSEETLSSCMLSSPARRDTDNSEDNTETPVVEFDEGYTAGHVDSKQPDITVCKEISPNSVGAETSSEETLSSFMLSSPARHDTINSEDNTETHVVDFVEGRNAVHVHSKQPDITVCRESSQNSLGTETSLEETLASCRLSLPARQDTTNSEDNSETPVADCEEEWTAMKLDSKQPETTVCRVVSSNSVRAVTLADVTTASCTLPSPDLHDSINSEAESKRSVPDLNQECADVKVDPKQAGIPTCSDISFDSVTLVWDQPQRNANAIQYYEVKYKIHEEKKWSSVDTEDKMNTFRIEGLKSNTAYDFRVRAVYDDDGDEDEAPLSSICQNIKTKEQTFKGPISTPCQNIVKREPSLRELQIGVKNPSDCKPTIQRLPLTVKQNSVNSQAKSRKYLFGKRSPGSFREKTVMVMGGTGAGKSTMINSVVNHIMDVQWEDHTRLSVIELSKEETENSIDESISQTEWITCYTIPEDESKLDYTLNIIDTPGFGDTRGIDRDRELVDHLRVFFNSSGEQGVEVLNAVWFVVKASDTRLTHSEKYVFDSILSIFGKDIEKSIFVLATFADNKNPPVLNTLRKAQVPFENAFVFNNSALFMNQEDHEENACGQHYWTRNTESFRQLFDVLGKTEKHSIQLSAEVLNIRRQLEVTIQGMHTHIHDGLTKMDRIKQEKNIVKNHETNVSANKIFEYDVTEEYKEMIDITGTGKFVTNCLKCNRTCHWPCGIAKDENKASCSAMMNGYCTVCTDKCYWDVHRNTPERYEVRLATVKKTYEDVKQRYINEQKKVQTHQTLLDSLKQDYKETEKHVSSSITRARESLNRLKEIALKEDPLSHVEYIDMLITCEKRDKKERFLERVDMLEAIKQKAELLANLSDVNPLTSFLDQC